MRWYRLKFDDCTVSDPVLNPFLRTSDGTARVHLTEGVPGLIRPGFNGHTSLLKSHG